MHNDYPWRKVFAPFKSCPGFVGVLGGRLDEIDTCICHRHVPNTIHQDIHLNIRLAGNSPAGYSARTILLPRTQKITHYGKNESYLTQWHTKGFQNIELVSLYSKSVSRENSKCLHFPSVQMKHIVPNRTFIFSS